jgi:hypothetical protein
LGRNRLIDDHFGVDVDKHRHPRRSTIEEILFFELLDVSLAKKRKYSPIAIFQSPAKVLKVFKYRITLLISPAYRGF